GDEGDSPLGHAAVLTPMASGGQCCPATRSRVLPGGALLIVVHCPAGIRIESRACRPCETPLTGESEDDGVASPSLGCAPSSSSRALPQWQPRRSRRSWP